MDLTPIFALAHQQHGVIASHQLLDLGYSYNAIHRIKKSGYFISPYRGVFVVAGTTSTWKQRAIASTLAYGRFSALSHESVLILFGLTNEETFYNKTRRRRQDQNSIHIVAHRGARPKRLNHFHRSITINKYDLFPTRDHIRHVPLERALIDCAQMLTNTELDYFLDISFRYKYISFTSLSSTLSLLRPAPGREKKRISKILRSYNDNDQKGVVESMLEKRVARILKESRINYIAQHNVQYKGRKYRLDFALPEIQLAIEVDGFSFHRNRNGFDGDRRRQNDLVIMGWKIIRITASFNDDEIRRTLHDHLC